MYRHNEYYIAYITTVNTLDVSEANLKRMEISKTCVLHAIGLVGGSCEANENDIPVLR